MKKQIKKINYDGQDICVEMANKDGNGKIISEAYATKDEVNTIKNKKEPIIDITYNIPNDSTIGEEIQLSDDICDVLNNNNTVIFRMPSPSIEEDGMILNITMIRTQIIGVGSLLYGNLFSDQNMALFSGMLFSQGLFALISFMFDAGNKRGSFIKTADFSSIMTTSNNLSTAVAAFKAKAKESKK